MNNKSVFVISERENFDYYRAIPLWEQRVECHPLDGTTSSIQQGDPDILIIDCGFDERRGLGLLHEIKATRPDIMVVLVTESGSVDTAVTAFRLGARDFFRKPLDLFELKNAIEKLQNFKGISNERRSTFGTAKPVDIPESFLPAAKDIPSNLLRVIRHIEKHLSELLTIDILATEAGASRFHFCRVFKKALGTTPMNFLLLMRIERARDLLRKNIPIATIAFKAGFSDQSNFNRHFKKVTGMTPTAYRDSLKL
jgi:AraC family transcriptional regulator